MAVFPAALRRSDLEGWESEIGAEKLDSVLRTLSDHQTGSVHRRFQRALELLSPAYSLSDPTVSVWLLQISIGLGSVYSNVHSFSKAFNLEELSSPSVFNIKLHQDCTGHTPQGCSPSEGVGPFLPKCWHLRTPSLQRCIFFLCKEVPEETQGLQTGIGKDKTSLSRELWGWNLVAVGPILSV